MKKLLAILLALMMVFTLAACGDNNTTDPDKDNPGASQSGEENKGGVNNDENLTLDNITDDNYEAVAKKLFGIDVDPGDGWTYVKAESLNKVTNFSVTYEGSTSDGKALMKKYFDAALALSAEGIYGKEVNFSTGGVKKTGPYSDFGSYYAAEPNETGDVLTAEWYFVFEGKSVEFSYSLQGEKLEIYFG